MGHLLSRWGHLASKGGHLVSSSSPSSCTDCCTVYCASCNAGVITKPITMALNGFNAGVGGGQSALGCTQGNCAAFDGTYTLSPGSIVSSGAAPLLASCQGWFYESAPAPCVNTAQTSLTLLANIFFNDTATPLATTPSMNCPAGWSMITLEIIMGISGIPGAPNVWYAYTQPGQFSCSWSYPLSYAGFVGVTGDPVNECCTIDSLSVQASM